MQDIGTLDSSPLAYSMARGINNAGDIVGVSSAPGASGAEYLYHNGVMRPLTSLIDPALGWEIYDAYAINTTGQIVGYGSHGGFLMTPRAAATPEPSFLLIFGVGSGVMLLAARRRCRTV